MMKYIMAHTLPYLPSHSSRINPIQLTAILCGEQVFVSDEIYWDTSCTVRVSNGQESTAEVTRK
jgi:hypothetical protein